MLLEFVEEDVYSDDEEQDKLYENCALISSVEPDIYAFAPRNRLDKELFLSLINNLQLTELAKKHQRMRIETKMTTLYVGEQGFVGSIGVGIFNTHPVCFKCQLTVPADLTYYVDETKQENVCSVCYTNENLHENTNTNEFKPIIIESGLDNVHDWICIFIYNSTEYYCNLNPNSIYYKQFAMNYYITLMGYNFCKLAETSMEEIIQSFLEEELRSCEFSWNYK